MLLYDPARLPLVPRGPGGGDLTNEGAASGSGAGGAGLCPGPGTESLDPAEEKRGEDSFRSGERRERAVAAPGLARG